MSGHILIKLNVSKVDKAHLFQGKKGKYLDVLLLANKDGTDQYGNDFMAVQGVSQEAREAGTKGAIIGNARYLGAKPQAKPDSPSAAPAPAVGELPEDEVPF